MPTKCPKCSATFKGRTVGSHIRRCPSGVTSIDLFWLKVNKEGAGGCWLWTGAMERHGYGHFRCDDRDHRAHRFSYELVHGPIAPHMEMLHTCDVKNCVNPAHLMVGTHHENMLDLKSKLKHSHGEKNSHAKLTEALVLEIRANPPKGKQGLAEYAAKYGVTAGTIYCAVSRRTWRHV